MTGMTRGTTSTLRRRRQAADSTTLDQRLTPLDPVERLVAMPPLTALLMGDDDDGTSIIAATARMVYEASELEELEERAVRASVIWSLVLAQTEVRAPPAPRLPRAARRPLRISRRHRLSHDRPRRPAWTSSSACG